MLKILLITLLIVAICVALLGIRIFFFKNGRFPHIHISGNKEMYNRGIGCVESQDKAAQRKSPFAVEERMRSAE